MHRRADTPFVELAAHLDEALPGSSSRQSHASADQASPFTSSAPQRTIAMSDAIHSAALSTETGRAGINPSSTVRRYTFERPECPSRGHSEVDANTNGRAKAVPIAADPLGECACDD